MIKSNEINKIEIKLSILSKTLPENIKLFSLSDSTLFSIKEKETDKIVGQIFYLTEKRVHANKLTLGTEFNLTDNIEKLFAKASTKLTEEIKKAGR